MKVLEDTEPSCRTGASLITPPINSSISIIRRRAVNSGSGHSSDNTVVSTLQSRLRETHLNSRTRDLLSSCIEGGIYVEKGDTGLS